MSMNFTDAIVLAVEKVKAWIQSGGVKWDHVSDKPFVKVGGDTLTWDGNTEGLVSVMDMLYKVSDAVPTKADFANGCTCTFAENIAGDKVEQIDSATVQAAFMDDGFAMFGFANCVIPHDNYTADDGNGGIIVFPEAGVYFGRNIIPNVGAIIVESLTIPNYTGFAKEQIDPKVLPKPEWGNIANKPFVVANLSFETMKLDITPDEILAINEAGGIVLLGLTMTPIMVSADEGGATDAAATQVSYGGEGNLVAVTYLFSADGTFTDTEQTMLTGAVLG